MINYNEAILQGLLKGRAPTVDEYQSLYAEALMEERILKSFPIEMGGSEAEESHFRWQMWAEGQHKYPGMTETAQSAQMYFELKYSKPVVFFDAETQRAIFVFRFDNDQYFSAIVPVEQAVAMVQRDLNNNLGYLHMFRADPFNAVDGITPDLARDKRKAIEKYIETFERITGAAVHDPLRKAVRDIVAAENKNVADDRINNESLQASFNLAYEYSRDPVMKGGLRTAQTEFTNRTNMIAREAQQERVKLWLWRN